MITGRRVHDRPDPRTREVLIEAVGASQMSLTTGGITLLTKREGTLDQIAPVLDELRTAPFE